MRNNIGKTGTIFIVAILANVFLVGTCFLLWYKIGEKADKINVRVEELAMQEIQKSSSFQLTNFIKKEVEPANEQMLEYFVHRDNFIDFIEHIDETLADKAGVEVDIQSTDLVKALQLDISFEGSFSDTMYFIALVESIPVNLEIDNVRVEQVLDGDVWQGRAIVLLPGSGGDNS